MILKAIEKNICTGCSACKAVCPSNAIELTAGELGFIYPMIDQNECIDCNRCNEICPALKPNQEIEIKEAAALINTDEKVREQSTSGGAFTSLANAVIDDGGCVCGAVFDDKFNIKHIIIDDAGDIFRLRGAKYVQSSISHIYPSIENALKKGRLVLFSGTPCQCDGIKAMFVEYENLLTCSVVCHGVPSPDVYKKYLKYVQGLLGEDIKTIEFRNKDTGWRNYSIKIVGKSGCIYNSSVDKDPFMKGFIESLYIRPSCHECTSKPINADFVLGDYWGIEKYHKDFDDDKGTSCIIINSKKGQEIFKKCKDIKTLKSSYEMMKENNPAFYKSAPYNELTTLFIKDFKTKSFESIINKYLSPDTHLQYIKRRISEIVKKSK